MSSRTGLRIATLMLAITLVIPALAAEGDFARRCEVGVQAGFFLPDEDVSNKDASIQELEGTGGLRFAFLFGKRFDVYLDNLFADINVNPPVGDVETSTYRAGVDFYFNPHSKRVQWFVGGGLGIIDADLEGAKNFERNFGSLSLGQKIRLDRRASFRWEVRADQYLDDNDILDGEDFSRIFGLIGVHWGLRPQAEKDSDGDGVPDSRDDCPDTPRGAIVDERGCPKDSDGDGVFDGIDRCPDTPKGCVVDEWGCPIDSDGDGVCDGIDRCPDTPKGCVVDEWGCPLDSDGDGVCDGIDRCPDTPAGCEVDEWGCPPDDDGDGVCDGLDKCPGTAAGVPVRPDGCPKEAPLFTPEKQSLVLQGVFFEFDSAVLKVESRETLDRVAQSLIDWGEVRVQVAGHTDSVGEDDYNQSLSERRARSVREYLVSKGVSANRLEALGFGEREPVADNRNKAGRLQNRRVELNKL